MQSLCEIEPLKSLKVQDVLDVPPDRIEAVEAKMLAHPNAKLAKDYHVEHRFSDGVYVRQILMPTGDLVLGFRHVTRHINIIQQGKAAVMMNGKCHIIKAPMIFESDAGVRKVLYILEGPMIWATVHVTPERDLAKLEAQLIEKSDVFLDYTAEQKALTDFVKRIESAGGLSRG